MMSLFVMKRTYPDEDQSTGVSYFVLSLGHFNHRKLGWAGALAQDLAYLRETKQNNKMIINI